jgi:hypothetical protein
MMRKVIVTFLLLFVTPLAQAEGIFKWTDESGTTHYTTDEKAPGFQKAELPEINRADVKLVTEPLLSCDGHGGIDCNAGPDKDGTVICGDGFTEANPIFRFSCSSPSLKIAELLDKLEDGSVKVLVRNSKSVAATKPQVLVREGSGKETVFAGPEEIAPFGVGEFILSPDKAKEVKQLLTMARIRVSCTNCP